MNIMSLIIQLIGGAVGGNVTGALAKNISLGPAGNTVAGGIGGLLFQVLGPMLGMGGAGAASMDIGAILGGLAGGGVSGAIVQLIVGFIKSRMR